MAFGLMDRLFTLANISTDVFVVFKYLAGLVVTVYAVFLSYKWKMSPLNSIPTVGYGNPLMSYITALRYLNAGPELLQEGYKKFGEKPFKVATLGRWVVVLCSRQHVQDLSGASDDILSITKPTIENFQADYTFGAQLLEDPYHVTTIRGPVTRNITTRFNEIDDETIHSMREYLPAGQDWITVPAYQTLLHIICRASNRFLLGSGMCRDPGYQDMSERLSHEILQTGRFLSLFPQFLKPIASKFSKIQKTITECREFLTPLILERLERHKSGKEKANDILSWFIDTSSQEYHLTIHDITRRVMMTNAASLHASNMALVQAMYDLAIHPEYKEDMRREIEAVIAEHGWTRRALHKLVKVDSFIKESHRLNTISSYLMVRETIQDFTLTDGTFIPRGCHIGIASGVLNTSEKIFEDPGTFKGFRFAEMREGEDDLDSMKYQLASLSPDSVMFGHGRHACPGRFLAIALMKIIFSRILLEYDVQLENGSMVRPPNIRNGIMSIPNQEAKLMFRKRASA